MKVVQVRSALLASTAASYVAFLAGRSTSPFFFSQSSTADISSASAGNSDATMTMPPPLLLDGRDDIPPSKYTSMVFDDSISKLDSLHLKSNSHADEEESKEVCEELANGRKQCYIDINNNVEHGSTTDSSPSSSSSSLPSEDSSKEDMKDEEVHLPTGQHLLVDIENVDKTFLNSEVRLANAMVDVVTESKLALLSYHCHKLLTMGVSCVGVLLESHISFHTWPQDGVITLDLFTCGQGKLVPVLPIIKKLFAIPQEPSSYKDEQQIDEPRVLWAHKLRGFRDKDDLDYLANDLGELILECTSFDMKEEIASAQTIFQRIDIYDTVENRHGIVLDGLEYRARHPELFLPERSVFLDGVLQSTREGLEAYHESLVQPVMFSHSHPKRVAIIGGGEGATLREVLKHDTVEKVKMIEIDEDMVMVSKEHLPEWNDCSDLVGSADDWCGDDDRADVYYEDALAWFKNRFSVNKIDSEEFKEEPFDVLIMDALDPQDDIPFAEMLYEDETFVESLYNALSDDGVIVFQLGSAPHLGDAADDMNKHRRRRTLIELLEEVGFESMHIYEEGNCGFFDPWMMLVAMKDSDNKKLWYRSQPEVDIAIHERIVRTKSGQPALKFYDGALQTTYHTPHKVYEAVYCRKEPMPESCIVDTEKRQDMPISVLDVRMSTVGDDSGRGVFSTVDIPQGNTIARKQNRLPVLVRPSTTYTIWKYMAESERIQHIYDYMDGYGWDADIFGDDTYIVDSSIMTFMNHGCNGSFNALDLDMVASDVVTESTATPTDVMPPRDVFDPVLDRHLIQSHNGVLVAVSDIKAGGEILCSYVHLTNDEDEWWDEVVALKNICNGDVGFITRKEMQANKNH